MVTQLFNKSLSLRATTEASSSIVRIPNANVYRFGDPDGARPVLRAVDWTVREGESWAVVGSGAGENTALLEVSQDELI
jgi:ABC-type molybdenum transport system ATPase subunit/photorepair protein PhrA